MRLLIQSATTGHFLVPGENGCPVWEPCLQRAGGGVVFDEEAAIQLCRDWLDQDERAILIDLDRLGTENDYRD